MNSSVELGRWQCLHVIRGQVRSVASLAYFESELLERLPDSARVRPVRLIQDFAGAADDPGHVWQRAICPMHFAVEGVNEHRALQAALLDELAGRFKLMFEAGVVRPVITGVGFLSVDKN